MPVVREPIRCILAEPFNLQRFLDAQAGVINEALGELRDGQKRSHWMWFVFPQLVGLGLSETSRYYGIASLKEAQAYLAHPILGPRLLECLEIVLKLENRTAREIFGSPDDLKLRSCVTLFSIADNRGQNHFTDTLDRYFQGQPDLNTIEILG